MFIACWKIAGAFDRPIGITFHWYNPSGVGNAVYGLLAGSISN
jgi:hypothetical protein